MDRAGTSRSDFRGVEGTNDSGEGTRVDPKRALEEMEEIDKEFESTIQENYSLKLANESLTEKAKEEIKNLKAKIQELEAENEKLVEDIGVWNALRRSVKNTHASKIRMRGCKTR